MAHKIEENSYVMTRPKQPGQNLYIEKAISYQYRKDVSELYKSSFNGLILNFEGLPKKLHSSCVNSIMPTISLIIFYEQQEIADQIRESFVQHASKEKLEMFESFPDQESGLCFILTEHLNSFIKYLREHGIEKAQEKYKTFYDVLNLVYFKLPVVHIFNLIDCAKP